MDVSRQDKGSKVLLGVFDLWLKELEAMIWSKGGTSVNQPRMDLDDWTLTRVLKWGNH